MAEEAPAVPVVTAAGRDHQDLVDVLVSDHRTIDDLFAQLARVHRDAGRIRDLVDVTVAELMRHEVAEEQYLFPAVRRCLDDGEELARAAPSLALRAGDKELRVAIAATLALGQTGGRTAVDALTDRPTSVEEL